MKKVIFICLLSLSVCLSKPADPQAPANVETAGQPNQQDPHSLPATSLAPADPAKNPAEDKEEKTPKTYLPPTQNSTAANPATNATAQEVPTSNTTEKTAATNIVPSKEEKKVEPAKNSTDAKVQPDKVVPTNDTHTTPEKKETTTNKPEEKTTDLKPTVAPKSTDKPVQARGFDGASFVGGIILTLGLLTIGFMGFKYYKNQTERNYHTL